MLCLCSLISDGLKLDKESSSRAITMANEINYDDIYDCKFSSFQVFKLSYSDFNQKIQRCVLYWIT